jgi:WXG100 family type VII secretion target
VIQKVKGSMEPLQSGGWIGRAADAFFDEMNSEVLPATDRLQKVLDQASQVTKQIVQTVRQAEDEASSLFRSQ